MDVVFFGWERGGGGGVFGVQELCDHYDRNHRHYMTGIGTTCELPGLFLMNQQTGT